MKYLSVVFLFATLTSTSQVSVNVNIGTPPPWGPVGYTEIRYYYLPDIEMYYDINSAQYIYLSNGTWIYSAGLPVWYKNYDLYKGPKVVIDDYFGPKPYIYYHSHKVKYPKGYKGSPPGQAKKMNNNNNSPQNAPHQSNGNANKGGGNNGNGHGNGHGHGKH